MLETIMLGVVTARNDATIMYSYRSWRNYTRAELAGKRLCARLAYQAEHESQEAKRIPKVVYRKSGG